MKSEVLYLKLEQDSQVLNRRIMVQDVAEIYSSDTNLVKDAGELVLYTVKGDKNQKLIFSAMKVIELIQKQHPGLTVENIGESDFVVEYKMPAPPKKGLEILKLVLLTLVVFFGAAFTIMTFNTDVGVGDVFKRIYFLIMRTQKEGGGVLEISYCIGLAIGILGFYNHFTSAKLHDDPTPIHIEMCNYEEEMNKAIIKNAVREGKAIK